MTLELVKDCFNPRRFAERRFDAYPLFLAVKPNTDANPFQAFDMTW